MAHPHSLVAPGYTLAQPAAQPDRTQPASPSAAVRLAPTSGVESTPTLQSEAKSRVTLNLEYRVTDVKSIEDAVRALPPTDLVEFRRWFTEFDSAAWDRQLEDDVLSGKLDGLLAEAEEDYKSAPHRPL